MTQAFGQEKEAEKFWQFFHIYSDRYPTLNTYIVEWNKNGAIAKACIT